VAVSLDPSPGQHGPSPEAGVASARKPIEGRSPGQIAWRRLRRDRVAMAGGILIVFLVLMAIIGPHVVQNPDTYNSNLINPTFSRPNGPWGGISLAHPLGMFLAFPLLVFVIGFFARPNLVAPILVYSTLLIPTNILFEAALDYLASGSYRPRRAGVRCFPTP
jgi:ABC-type dipeptide/oligopeptide/nickel transport system permease subunit